MPYVNSAFRQAMQEELEPLAACIDDEGSFNYAVTYLCHSFIQRKGLRYATLNRAIGVLECAKLELYRMIAAPYEDIKKKENGPISALDTEYENEKSS
jgi:hypothetical protein